MNSLQNKKIVLAISGGIAAYKCPELVRQLKKQGAEVRIMMTAAATQFVSSLSLQAVSGHAVATSLFDEASERAMSHIDLAKWADLILIAPCTANVIAKMAAGLADDLLTTTLLASAAPIAIAPAMNQQMYHAPITQHNLQTLAQRGVQIWGPDQGEQACGDLGSGRMRDPEALVAHCQKHFTSSNDPITQPLLGQTVVITAGPTQEPLDPVRFISNHSSGKMGFALAEQAKALGAKVILIAGPVHLPYPQGVEVVAVQTALEMHDAAMRFAPQSTIFIGCAAVADYRAATIAPQKIKKTDESDTLQLTLVKNPDIIADVAHLPQAQRPFVVGFAAETTNIDAYAQKKLMTKQLDLICANDVSHSEIGFNSDRNALTIYRRDGERWSLPAAPKTEIAYQLLHWIAQTCPLKSSNIEA